MRKVYCICWQSFMATACLGAGLFRVILMYHAWWPNSSELGQHSCVLAHPISTCTELTSTVTNGYICSAAMLAQGSAARSSTLSLWLRVTMMTGWPSSLGLRSMDSTSPLLARATVAVVHMAYKGFRDGLSTLTGVVGWALFMLLGRGLLLPLAADLPNGGVPALRSGELLPGLAAVQGLLASA